MNKDNSYLVGIPVVLNDTLKSFGKQIFVNDFMHTLITLWHGDYDHAETVSSSFLLKLNVVHLM